MSVQTCTIQESIELVRTNVLLLLIAVHANGKQFFYSFNCISSFHCKIICMPHRTKICRETISLNVHWNMEYPFGYFCHAHLYVRNIKNCNIIIKIVIWWGRWKQYDIHVQGNQLNHWQSASWTTNTKKASNKCNEHRRMFINNL